MFDDQAVLPPAEPARHSHPSQTLEQKVEINSLGMWLFLAGEVMFFGVLFTGYSVYRYLYPQTFAEASRHLDITLGSINTFILLTSSFTMVMAVDAIRRGQRRLMIALLLVTMLLGLTFLGIKGLEYVHKIEQGLFPNINFVYDGSDPNQARLFFSLYFLMTGLHAIHMLLGVIALAGLSFMGWRKVFNAHNYVPVEMIGLFWHFIDIIWIFIFPLLYLISRTR